MSRRNQGSSTRSKRKRIILARLAVGESADVLRVLLERHPELVAEAEEIARATLSDVDAVAVADDVEQAVLDLDIDDLGARAGRKSWGYVEPTEAAWELLEETIAPFIQDMNRQIDLACEGGATAVCAGIVVGLYRCRGKNPDHVLGWAPDFLEEAADNAMATLERQSRAKHRRAWRIPEAMIEQVPEWAAMIAQASQPSSRR